MKPLYTLLFLVAVSSVTAAARQLRPPPSVLHHCPINQVYKACKGCDLRCEDMGAFRICPKICVPGCACADGYVKNPDGKCVRQEDCPYPYKPFHKPSPVICPPNEEYRRCQGCDQTCENLGKPVICTFECVSGCACKRGYVRHDGKCIQQLQCPISSPIPILPDDFVLSPNDTPYFSEDIPLDTFSPPIDLMPETCPINEVFSQCKACDQGCPGIDPPVACTKDCRPGCSCKEGYVRSHGKCINKLQCPQIEPMPVELAHEPQIVDDDCDDTAPPSCPANQHFAECLPCNEACPGFGSDICPLICKSGCACDPGFSRMENGRCIPTIQCPQIDPMPPTDDTCEATIDILPPERAQTKCPANEEFTECGSCEPTCQSLRNPTGCLTVCIVGCQCKAGFVRENGVCIPAYQCPLDYPRGPYLDQVDPPVVEDDSCLDQVAPSCPVNEHFDQCLPCNEQCPGFGSDICLLMCQSGCACDNGFSRVGSKCIPTHQCPQIDPMPTFNDAIPVPPGIPDTLPVSVDRPDLSANDHIAFYPIPTQPVDQCPKNEVYSTCGGCEETCESLFQPMMCAAVCVVGCQCKPGYLREKGQCVDASFCPARNPTAPTLDIIKEGYVTLDTIKKESATLDVTQGTPEASQCPINEVFKECKSCDQTCGSLSDPLMCTMECVPGCSCLEGYVRDNGVCVPVSQCFEELANPLDVKPVDEKPAPEEPKKPQVEQRCPVNEEFKSCKGCDHTCRTLDHPIMCSMICMPGCACKSGFVRKDGVCVAPSECRVENTSSRYFESFNEMPVSSVEMDMAPFISMFAEPQSSALPIP